MYLFLNKNFKIIATFVRLSAITKTPIKYSQLGGNESNKRMNERKPIKYASILT